MTKDAVTYVTSGLIDGNNGQVLSYLNKSIKSLNQLRWMEDSIVIYRMARAPERRLFYIDVGNLPKQKAEQYLRDVMSRYRTKISYDQSTGEIRTIRSSPLCWKTTGCPVVKVVVVLKLTPCLVVRTWVNLLTLQYFKDKLFRSLNVPASRMEEGGGFQLGKSDNILRDEVKFAKFVGRMRKKFSSCSPIS